MSNPVIYRPPLWSQNSSYAAIDDRKLVEATLLDGVIGRDDFRVQPRAEGANLSVDVLPGLFAVKGTDQADQGTYLCPLSQRVNIPLVAGPAAGQSRMDLICCRVYEPGGSAPAYFTVERIGGQASSAAQPPWPALPSSAGAIAAIGPIVQSTAQITTGLIRDFRHQARPSPIGGNVLRTKRMPGLYPWDTYNYPGQWWGTPVNIVAPPWPVNIQVDLVGASESQEYNELSELGVETYLSTNPDQGWTNWDRTAYVVSEGKNHPTFFAGMLDVDDVVANKLIQVRVYAYVRPPHLGAYPVKKVFATHCDVRVRVSPAALSPDWESYPNTPDNRPSGN